MEEKTRFFGTVLGMLKGLIHPAEYIETGKKATWFSVHWLIIIVSIVLPVIIFYIPVSRQVGYNRLADAIDDRIAYFSVSEDGFYCKKTYEMKRQGGAYIRIDSNNYAVEADEIEELLEEGRYSTMVIITNQEILLYSDDSPTRFSWESIYDHLQAIEKRDVYDKEILLTLTRKYDTPLLIAVSLLLSLLLLFSAYIAGMLWAALCSLIKYAFGLSDEVEFSDLMKGAILIRTPWFVLAVLLGGFVLKGHFILLYCIGAFITCFYVIAALKLYAGKILSIPQKPVTEEETDAADDEYYGD